MSLKRLYLGLQLGKRSYNTYGEKLANTINKMLLVSEVATLSWRRPGFCEGGSALNLNTMSFDTTDEASAQNPSQLGGASAGQQSKHGSMFYSSSNKQLIMQQLEQWEEPILMKTKKVSCQKILC